MNNLSMSVGNMKFTQKHADNIPQWRRALIKAAEAGDSYVKPSSNTAWRATHKESMRAFHKQLRKCEFLEKALERAS